MEQVNFFDQIQLGQTGLKVGKIGISSSYGANTEVFEAAFEKGFNYFSWGTFIKGRSKEMENSIKNIIKKGKRNELVISTYGYYHNGLLNKISIQNGLKRLGIDYFDVLILGYHNSKLNKKILEKALELKDKGLVKAIGISSHNRKLIGKLIDKNVLDIYHLRYNAAHRGAEKDIFPFIKDNNKPGIVSYTATRWGQLLNSKKMPVGEKTPTAGDCYRFVLSNNSIDVCMMGVKTMEQYIENIKELEKGPMTQEELEKMKKIGDFVYGRK